MECKFSIDNQLKLEWIKNNWFCSKSFKACVKISIVFFVALVLSICMFFSSVCSNVLLNTFICVLIPVCIIGLFLFSYKKTREELSKRKDEVVCIRDNKLFYSYYKDIAYIDVFGDQEQQLAKIDVVVNLDVCKITFYKKNSLLFFEDGLEISQQIIKDGCFERALDNETSVFYIANYFEPDLSITLNDLVKSTRFIIEDKRKIKIKKDEV